MLEHHEWECCEVDTLDVFALAYLSTAPVVRPARFFLPNYVGLIERAGMFITLLLDTI